MSYKMSENWMNLNYKQYKQRLRDTVYMALQDVTVEEQCPTVLEVCQVQLIITLLFPQITVDTVVQRKST